MLKKILFLSTVLILTSLTRGLVASAYYSSENQAYEYSYISDNAQDNCELAELLITPRGPHLAGISGFVPNTGWYAFWSAHDPLSTITLPGGTLFRVVSGNVVNGRILITNLSANFPFDVWVPARHFGA